MTLRDLSSGVSSELLGLVIDSMPSGVLVVNSAGTIVLVNPETERLFLYGRDELIGKRVEILLPEKFRAGHPKLRDDFFASPESRRMGLGRELFGLRKDGTEFPIEIGLNPVKTTEGMFVVSAIADISERFHAAEQLARAQHFASLNLAQDALKARKRAEQSEERLNLALRSSGVGTWSWDVTEDSITWDDYIHALFGRQPGTLPSHFDDVMPLLHPDDQERVRREVRRTIKTGESYEIEHRVIWEDGSVHALAAQGKVYRDQTGRALRMAGVCWDITERKRLEEKAEHLAAVIEFSDDAIISKDLDGTIRSWNHGAQRMFGYSAEEMIGKSIRVLLTPERLEEEEEVMERLRRGERVQHFETQRVHKDGSRIEVSVTVSPILNSSGQIIGASKIARDITERKRKEEESRLTERRLDLALDATQMGVWDLDLINDQAWRSLKHDQIFGYKTPLPNWGTETFLAQVVPEDQAVVRRSFADSRVTDNFSVECRIRWPDQSVHWISARGHVNRNENGEPSRMMGLVANIDERKKSEERFRATVEAAPTAMMVVNPAGIIVLVNRQSEDLFRYQRSELIGQNVELLIPDRFRASHREQFERFFKRPVQRDMGKALDLYGVRKDSSEFPVKIGLSPVETADGLAVICGIIDVTDQKQALEAMRQAKEAAESASLAKSSFLANMSHEIRTPMNGIIGMAQLLAQTELRSHQRDYLATVEESAHILLRLLNDILDFSKIEAGKLELESVEFRLSECVGRAAQMLVLRAAEKGLEIACRIAPEIPDHLRGDSGRIQQVLVNLLGNAVKFTEAGEIFVNVDTVSIEDHAAKLHFSVSDTGIGISADKQEQIFRPFEQAESSTTRRFGGTGLGLTISRQLVELMKGKMWVESRPGRGSTFHFLVELEIAAEQHDHEPADLDSLFELPVLVVDDNFTNRHILSELLHYWHMQPVLADSAAAARNAMNDADELDRPIRLILLDHHMPGEDGLQFAKSLRGSHSRSQIPIIMISSGSSPVDAEVCQKHGIGRFMTKPVVASELLNEVLRQFGRYTTVHAPHLQTAETATHVLTRRVLLVEDNEINRRVAVGLLRSRGHQVATAENGQEAVDMLANQEFDVVLMDMQMPVMDGYEATAEIREREHQTGGRIPIVAMTAEALKGDRERCLANGMDDYVAKPIVPAEMYRAVERFPALCLLPDPALLNSPELATTNPKAPPEKHEDLPVEPQVRAVTADSSPREVATVIDWNIAKERLGGGLEVLREFSDLLKTQIPQLLSDIRRAMETRDAKLLRRSAHTLKGSVTYFGGESLVQAALELENLGRSESFDDAVEVLPEFERKVDQFLSTLEIGPPETAS